MRTLPLGPAILLVPFLSLGTAQESRRAIDPAGAPPTAQPQGPDLARTGIALPPLDNRNVRIEIGEGLPARLDDSVPLPVPRTVASGPDGDRVVAEASGDPFFLSFAGGNLYPPASEHVDPALLQAASAALAAGRTETYAFVMFQKRMTAERVAALEALGIRTITFHPHYCLSVAVPIGAIGACASLDFVRWIGVPTIQQKLHPVLATELAQSPPPESLDVWIDVLESDLSAGAQSRVAATSSLWDAGVTRPGTAQATLVTSSGGPRERALQALGVRIVEYIDSIRAFRARIAPSVLEELLALDCVQFVEPDLAPTLFHDESRPMVANDIVRGYYTGGTSQGVTVGVIDSGFDTPHQGFSGLWAVGWNFNPTGSVFQDGCEHGSHVLGTILGGGNVIPSLSGNAPGLARWGGTGRAFLARAFSDTCAGANVSLSTLASVMNNNYFDGVSWSPRPVAINCSWGTNAPSGGWIGSEASARFFDNQIYWNGQAWIFAVGNSGPTANTISQEASAKNVISVGSVSDFQANGFDPGNPAFDTGIGPCADGRWKPNVCAPGTSIRSVDANSGNGYKDLSGTSMAAPHVTGLVEQLLDGSSWLRYRSCAVQSVLMASATTKSNAVLTSPPTSSSDHLNVFGAGRIDGMRTVVGTGDSYWNTWTFDQAWTNWNYGDFLVPNGTTRIVVCMHYDEDQSSAGAGHALINDWDLFIDQDPVDPLNGNTGEWTAQQSTKDNTEIRILNNPLVGPWRWKVYPRSVTNNSVVRFGVTVYFIMGATTPTMQIQTWTSDAYVKPNEATNIHTSVSNLSSFNASAVFLDESDLYSTIYSATHVLYDGTTANLTNNQAGGRKIMLGDIPRYYTRAVDWTVSWPWEGNWPWQTMIRGDNFTTVADFGTSITVDGTPPSAPAPWSTTHVPWYWSTTGPAQFAWSTPSDNLAGVEGYSVSISQWGPQDPGTTLTLSLVNGWSTNMPSSAIPCYMNLRAVDRCGNWSPTGSTGPFYVDYSPPAAATNVGSTLSPGNWVGGAGLSSFHGYWDPVVDYESGLYGYAVDLDQNPGTIPPSVNQYAGTTTYDTLVTATGAFYFHVRTRDNAGNWGPTVHTGPYLFNLSPNTIYCTAKVNSLGCTPSISAVNHGSVYYTSNFIVSGSNVRNNKPGILLYSTTGVAFTPFQGGTLCVAAPVRRSNTVLSGGSPTGNDCSGVYQIDMNMFAHGLLGGSPQPELLVQGTLVRCQWWGRDPGFLPPNNSTLSNALEYFVCQY